MNTYEIEGMQYRAINEYEAVKQAYKMASRIVMVAYTGLETWIYAAMFQCSNGSGKSNVTVKKVQGETAMKNEMSDTWVTIQASNPLPEEDRIFAAWYYKINNWFCF